MKGDVLKLFSILTPSQGIFVESNISISNKRKQQQKTGVKKNQICQNYNRFKRRLSSIFRKNFSKTNKII